MKQYKHNNFLNTKKSNYFLHSNTNYLSNGINCHINTIYFNRQNKSDGTMKKISLYLGIFYILMILGGSVNSAAIPTREAGKTDSKQKEIPNNFEKLRELVIEENFDRETENLLLVQLNIAHQKYKNGSHDACIEKLNILNKIVMNLGISGEISLLSANYLIFKTFKLISHFN